MKRCSKCGIEKWLSEFSIDRKNKDGYKSHCKACVKEYREANKESIREYKKEYCEANRESINEKKKEYREANRESINEYMKEYEKARSKIDSLYKMRRNISKNIRGSFARNGYSKKSRTHEILGCSYDEFRDHLESQFVEGMTWENMGEWHLDHKIPVSYGENEEEVKALNHHSNFQPLWGDDNLKKGNRRMD